jgi:hypothetical protein
MSYLRPLGDVSPSEARVQSLATFIVTKRKQGQSDDTIRRYLSLPGPLPLSHPCAGGSGQQLCADWEISQAFGNASLLSALAPAAGGAGEKAGLDWGDLAGLLSPRNLLIAGAAVTAIWFMRRK